MQTIVRRPLQGLSNIVRFNWHFYVMAATGIIFLLLAKQFLLPGNNGLVSLLIFFITVPLVVSLLISFYVYDLSDLYKFKWLEQLQVSSTSTIVNINAGFDESSQVIKKMFPLATLRVVDFYDPAKHTEVSIKRARKAYPAFMGTESINTLEPFLEEKSADFIFLILAAHEIRNFDERKSFFIHLQRALKDEGKLVVVEHLRDLPNFLAYTLGFFHFYSEQQWKKTFRESGLFINNQQNITKFITVFTLNKNGTSS